jgi:hypothetical protein
MTKEPQTLEQELLLGGAGSVEARELAGLARRLPELRQLPLLQTPPSLQMDRRVLRRRLWLRRVPLAGLFTGAAATAAMLMAVVTAAAQPAVPGDALYSVKRASEAVAVRLAPGFHDEIMMRRAEEVSTLIQRDSNPRLTRATLASYDQAVTQNPAGSYAARDYCAGMLRSAAAKADPATRAEIMQSLSRLKLDES